MQGIISKWDLLHPLVMAQFSGQELIYLGPDADGLLRPGKTEPLTDLVYDRSPASQKIFEKDKAAD